MIIYCDTIAVQYQKVGLFYALRYVSILTRLKIASVLTRVNKSVSSLGQD
jgi:hypothetical protein